MEWMLWAVLSTGEAGPVPVSAAICMRVENEVSAGHVVEAERDHDMPVIVEATCIGPWLSPAADVCEMEGLS